MAQAPSQELTDRFVSFFRNYYRTEIGRLAQRYPNEQRSLYVDYDDLYQFDPDLAEDYLNQPDQLREYAEEALRLYDLPADVKLGQAHVRVRNVPSRVDIRNIRVHDDHVGRMVAVSGIVRKATDVRPKITEAAFECQRCGTMTYIPQSDTGFQEPHECQGCERQGPFRVNFDQSEFVDSQKLRVQESPEGLRGGETPQAIDVDVVDDLTGKVTPGDHVTVTGVLHIEQQTEGNEKSPIFDLYMDGVSLEIEDEEFEDMDITEADKEEIVRLSNEPNLYEKMVDSIAPNIFGYEEEKLAIILQLFSGVTKHLPDGSRIRGDLHMLLIGDPGTGKSQLLSYVQNIAPRSVYTSGKGSSSAGLTAAAVRSDFGDGDQWTLEAGALVLADKGIAAVDELDKMRCVTGDTLVHTSDGIVPIRDLARRAEGNVEQLSNGRTIRDDVTTVWTMDGEGRLVTRPVTAVHEYDAPEELYEVRLESGESVTTTADHPFIVLDTGHRTERPATDLETGDWVYVPESIHPPTTDGGVSSLGDDDSNGSAVSAALDGSKPLNPAKGAILGYLAGDGNVYSDYDDGSHGIRFTNAEEQLLSHFESVCREAYDADPVRHPSEQREDGVETVRLHGRDYVDDLLDAGLSLETYEGKRVPIEVTRADRGTKAAFVRALADSEASATECTVKIHSSSYELLLGVKMLLLEFGIRGQIQMQKRAGKRDLYILAITDADSLQTYEREVGFTLDRKQTALVDALDRVSGDRAILDVVPDVGSTLRQLRESLRLHQSECGLNGATYCDFENGRANPSIHRTARVRSQFEQRRKRASEDLNSLDECTNWDRLAELRSTYHVSQRELAEGTDYSQQQVSARWGEDDDLRNVVIGRLRTLLEGVSGTSLVELSELVDGDVRWRRVEGVNIVSPSAGDVRVPVLERKISSELSCHPDDSRARAEALLATEPTAETWDELREELDRHGISFQQLATKLDVSGSTVSRWFSGSVDVGNFEKVRTAAFCLVNEIRASIKPLYDEIVTRTRSPKVYDLTVEGTHNFVANGMIVHNSEDRSAMHEALEQQSYHPSQELLLADGRRVPIGDLVDERMAARRDEVVDGVDCEILPVEGLRVHSTDVETGETTKRQVDRVSRHEAPEEFVRLTFSNGREILVTPEHPTFVERDGDVQTVPASDVRRGEPVPAPRKLPNSTAPVELDAGPEGGATGGGDLPAELTPALAELLGQLLATGVGPDEHGAGGVEENAERARPWRTELLGRVFGTDTDGEERTSNGRDGDGDAVTEWGPEALRARVMGAVTDGSSDPDARRVPAAVLGASEEHIRRFLVGVVAASDTAAIATATDADGDRPTTIPAASTALAADYADALAKLGIGAAVDDRPGADGAAVTVAAGERDAFARRVLEPARAIRSQPSVPRGADVVDRPTEESPEAPDTARGEHTGLRRYHVTDVETVPNDGEYATDWVYDVTVEPTNTFVGQGVVLHNSVSIAKAGINATLKSRCSLLGAANPKYGRFDEYEPIAEQIDLEPALISRFDLIFTVTDRPDPEHDRDLAEHILRTNYAGELNTQRTQLQTSNFTQEEVDSVTEEVAPEIDADLLRKYVAYAKRNCYPTMTEAAKEILRDFYVDFRSKGSDEDSPVPITARKLEALVRLAEASARIRLSDTVEVEDAERVTEIVESCLREIGMDPETGEFDADVVETGTSKSQRDRIKSLKGLIQDIEADYEEGAPVEEVLDRADEIGMDRSKAEAEIEKLKNKGDIYQPKQDHLRVV
jgi:replicative DNA helicase Mcm